MPRASASRQGAGRRRAARAPSSAASGICEWIDAAVSMKCGFPIGVSRGSPRRAGAAHRDRRRSARAARSATPAGRTRGAATMPATACKTLDDIHAVVAFFEERRGRLHGFRWQRPCRFQILRAGAAPSPRPTRRSAPATARRATFQLREDLRHRTCATYVRDHRASRCAGTVRVAVTGVEKIAGDDFNVDATTGLVTFLPGMIPAAGAAVTAGFEFDVPVRFDTDELDHQSRGFRGRRHPRHPARRDRRMRTHRRPACRRISTAARRRCAGAGS